MTHKKIDERINRLSKGKCMFMQKIFQQVGTELKQKSPVQVGELANIFKTIITMSDAQVYYKIYASKEEIDLGFYITQNLEDVIDTWHQEHEGYPVTAPVIEPILLTAEEVEIIKENIEFKY